MVWAITPQQPFAASALLDNSPAAIAAYSLRSLVGTSNPNVIRVRRSSDNTEQDFTALQVINGTLTTFCGAGNGFVRTWYDQSGNANHAAQTTTTLQPQIVSGGSLVTTSTKPAISFNGSGVRLTVATGLAGFFQGMDAYIVKNTSDTDYTLFSGGGNQYSFVSTQSSSNTIISSSYGGNLFVNGNQFSGQNRGDVYNSTNGRVIEVHQNSSLHTFEYFDIGDYARLGSISYTGTIQELVFYRPSNPSNRRGIESALNAYYGIY